MAGNRQGSFRTVGIGSLALAAFAWGASAQDKPLAPEAAKACLAQAAGLKSSQTRLDQERTGLTKAKADLARQSARVERAGIQMKRTDLAQRAAFDKLSAEYLAALDRVNGTLVPALAAGESRFKADLAAFNRDCAGKSYE